MKVLALDFAWRNTGWVVVGEDGPERWGVITTKPRKKENKYDKNPLLDIEHECQNYYYIKIALCNLFGFSDESEFLSRLDVVAEVTYFAQQSFHGILIGMGWSLLNSIGADFLIGSQVKSLLLGNKTASKADIARYVYKHGGLKLMMEKDHVKDAYATYLAWKKLKNLKQLTR